MSGEPNYSEMNVNERLSVAGLLDAWDAAINSGNTKAAVEVLCKVDLEEQAERIVETTLTNPAKYGFPSPF